MQEKVEFLIEQNKMEIENLYISEDEKREIKLDILFERIGNLMGYLTVGLLVAVLVIQLTK